MQQVEITNRLPKPNAPVVAGSLATLPSLSGRKRSGWKAKGSGYSSGSCSMFLLVASGIASPMQKKQGHAHHTFAITTAPFGM